MPNNRKSPGCPYFFRIFFICMLFTGLSLNTANAQSNNNNLRYWGWLQSSLVAQERLLELNKSMKPEDMLITNVNIVMLPDGSVMRGAAILIKNGSIAWLGQTGNAPATGEIKTVDGEGRYISPGLTNMHVHTIDAADYLLQLSMGITTIREMNGSGWLLARKHAVERGLLFAPNMSITSQILNSSDFGGYAIPVNTREEARNEVQKAAQMGFEAIKIHNGLANDIFHAIAEEADAAGLPLVGHIPVRVTVEEAINAGMHTAEHFKGYIDDSVLQISDEDWYTASINSRIYLTPTFYTYREHLRGEAARKIYDADAMFVPPYRRQAWMGYVNGETNDLTKLRQTILPKSEKIFKTLLPLNLNWLAGTDSGSYELMVPGHALIEEMEIMERLGLSTLETLKSATTNAANAMGWQKRTGRIAVGLQADFILLDNNPLENISNLRTVNAVMVRGIWIDAPASLPIQNNDYYNLTGDITPEMLENAVKKLKINQDVGYVLASDNLEVWAFLMRENGLDRLSTQLLDMRIDK